MVDAWTDPSNPPTPQQFPRNYTRDDGIAKLLDKIKGIETNLREVTSNLLRTAGIYLSPTGMTIDSDLTLTGTLTAAGIITNDALDSPVAPAVGHADALNFALTTAWIERLRVTIAVPAGYTQALVIATGNIVAANSTAGADRVSIFVGDGPGQAPVSSPVSAGLISGSVSHTSTLLATGLGASLVVKGYAFTSFASWAASGSNTMNLDVMALFLR